MKLADLYGLLILLVLLTVTFLVGCSSGGNIDPIIPTQMNDAAYDSGSHYTWGLWQFVADPEAETLDMIRLRNGNMHVNVLPFLEPPPLTMLTLESLEFNGNIIEADIGLRHPFLGLTEFTGFDVCGILISNGSITGFNDPDLKITGDGDTRLLNPDGLTRWWNPAEFPVNEGTIFSYNDGLLGAPDSFADFDCTLNGYKYFCDDLDPDDGLDSVSIDSRGMFSAGQKNTRHYTIELGTGGLIFNYAIDANWIFPEGGPPWLAPDDFPPAANRPEAWRINVTETENTLWNDGDANGGNLTLAIDVYDWFDAELNMVRVESGDNFGMVESTTVIDGGIGYSTYEVEIIDATPTTGTINLLISVISEVENFGGYIEGTNITSYFTYTADVAGEPFISPCKNIPLRDAANAVDIAVDHTNGDLLVMYDDKAIYRHQKVDGCYGAGEHFFDVTDHLTQILYAFDIAPSRYIGVTLTYVTTETPGLWIYSPEGVFQEGTGQAPPAPIEAFAMTGGTYLNDIGYVRGYTNTAGDYTTQAMREEHLNWFPPAGHHLFTVSPGDTGGIDKIYSAWIKGAESDMTGNYLWFVEDPDYYATRWELYMVSYQGYLGYDSAYFGTGYQTDDDDGWNDAKDITRDNQNNYFVLDGLQSGQARVKMWSVDGDETTSLGGFGNSTTITGPPIKIEGSDYDGDIVVLHGDTLPYMVSVFYPYEMPGG